MQAPAEDLRPDLSESYRSNVTHVSGRFQKHFDFIDINEDDVFLLGTSNLTGRIWSGSLWLFNDPLDPPDVKNCVAGMDFECGIPVGKWFDNGRQIIVGADSGALHILSLACMGDVKKHYLSTMAIVSEHDDSILTVDVSASPTKFLSSGLDMNIKLWDAETITSEKTYDSAHTHTVTSTCFQPGRSEIFISASTDGTSLLWDTTLDKPASLLMTSSSGYTAASWIDENCVALGSNSGSVSIVDIRMKSEIDCKFCSRRPIHNINYNASSELLAVCADDPIVRVFSCKDNLLTIIYENEQHKDFIRGMTWKSLCNLYTCAWDSKIFSHEICDKKAFGSNTVCDSEVQKDNGEEEKKH